MMLSSIGHNPASLTSSGLAILQIMSCLSFDSVAMYSALRLGGCGVATEKEKVTLGSMQLLLYTSGTK